MTTALLETTQEIIAASLERIENPYQATSACLGPSKISTYLRCPNSYRLQYVDKVRMPASPAMMVGTCFHDVAEQIRPQKWTAADADKAGALLLQNWQEARGLTTDPDDPEASDSINQAVVEWLPWYLWFLGHGQDIDLESRWEFPVGDTGVTLRGTIDRLYIQDGAVIISDLKTGKRAPTKTEKKDPITGQTVTCYPDLDRDLQGSLYWWAVRQEGVQPARFEQVMPRKQASFPTTRTDGYLQAVIEQVVLPAARGIKRKVFPCNPSPVYGCNFCNHQSLCAVGRGAQGED